MRWINFILTFSVKNAKAICHGMIFLLTIFPFGGINPTRSAMYTRIADQGIDMVVARFFWRWM